MCDKIFDRPLRSSRHGLCPIFGWERLQQLDQFSAESSVELCAGGHAHSVAEMPELPEMQALAERIADALVGQVFTGYRLMAFSALKTFEPPPESIQGLPLQCVSRRGKFLIFDFDSSRMLVHLSQGGRVDLEEPPKSTKPKFGVVRLVFESKALFLKEYGTERKVGWWILRSGEDGPLDKLGPEPFSDEFTAFIADGEDNRRIHTILRDQRTVAGIGRGYTDDILHEARLSPYSSLRSLRSDERSRLHAALARVLHAGIGAERKRTGGLPTKIGDHWVVHNNAGLPCPVCGQDLRRVSYESHEVTYCPNCQTEGRILADRRMSRLIR